MKHNIFDKKYFYIALKSTGFVYVVKLNRITSKQKLNENEHIEKVAHAANSDENYLISQKYVKHLPT